MTRPPAREFTEDGNAAKLARMVGDRPNRVASDDPMVPGGASTDAAGDDRASSRGSRIASLLADLLRPSGAGPTLRRIHRDRWFELDTDGFVRLAYRSLLGREATEQALRYWVSRLRAGDSRRAILETIRFSHEGRTRFVDDPGLRSILAFSRLRRMLPSWLRVRGGGGVSRRLRRIEAGQSALAAEMAAVAKAPPAAMAAAPALLSHPERLPRAIGASHTLLVAPGTSLDRDTLAWFEEATRASDCDLVIGDEIERADPPSRERRRRHGPFSHDAFLQMPDLGGAIAVHDALLERLGLPPTIVLTGRVALDLVGHAHTITYANAVVAHRSPASIAANLPSLEQVRSYASRVRRAEVAMSDGYFDVRFPLEAPTKAAIVIVAATDADEPRVALTLSRIRELTDPQSYVPVVARPSPAERRYGVLVNEAVGAAPEHCELVVIVDGGVMPTGRDWLERLAETAMSRHVGLVAPRTMYADGRIRHAGIAFGSGDPCVYIGRLDRLDDLRWAGDGVDHARMTGLRDVSAASRHCQVIRRKVFVDIGGYAEDLDRDAADVDLCLRLRNFGKSVLVDGRVVMEQHDDYPRWGRAPPRAQVERLAKTYPALGKADAFCVPAKNGADAMPELHTTRLAPIEHR